MSQPRPFRIQIGRPGGGLRDRGRRAAGHHRGESRAGYGPRRAGPGQRTDVRHAREQVTGPQPGQAPRLGQAAHDDQPGDVTRPGQAFRLPGHAVGERLVDDEQAAGPGQRPDRRGRVQDRGRVRRVAHHDQVRVRRHGPGIEPEAAAEDDPVHRVPGRPQRRLRLGELRVHDDRVAGPEGPGDQGECLRGPGGDQDLGRGPGVPAGGRFGRGARVRVGGEVTGRGADTVQQPRRRGARADVHGQVGQAIGELTVAVEGQVRPGRGDVEPRVSPHRRGRERGHGHGRPGGRAAAAARRRGARGRAARPGTGTCRSSS